jgi:hypothetical protein
MRKTDELNFEALFFVMTFLIRLCVICQFAKYHAPMNQFMDLTKKCENIEIKMR